MKNYSSFFRYSYGPFCLYYCGPKAGKLRKIVEQSFVSGFMSLADFKKVIRQFIAVNAYLEVIARKNRLSVWNPKVIEAYWIGNELLEKVTPADLKKMILKKFVDSGKFSKEKAESLCWNMPQGVVAHHSFHVFYLGSVTNVIKLQGKLLDICRIGWGKVIRVKSTKGKVQAVKSKVKSSGELVVSYQPLAIIRGKLSLSSGKIKKKIQWNEKILPQVKTGQTVTFHWNQVCEIISAKEINNLNKYTLRNIKAINLAKKYDL
jgi:hypothetical protein